MHRFGLGLLVAGLLATTTMVRAQDEEAPSETDATDIGDDDLSGDDLDGDDFSGDDLDEEPPEQELLGDEQVLTEERFGGGEARSSTDPRELEGDKTFYLGFFYHHHWVPEFILNIFTDDSVPASNPQLGLEFTYRRKTSDTGGIDIIASVYYATFHVTGPFRGEGDPATEVEIIDSDLKALMASATFLWTVDLHPMVQFGGGFGLGVGAVIGNMTRNEAYPDDGPGSRNGFSACAQEGDPANPVYCGPVTRVPGTFREADPDRGLPASNFDGEDGEHYQVEARRWTDGGSVPNVWFRLAPQVSLRVKPIRQVMTRLDFGFDIFSGFFFGGAVAYGF